MKKGISLVALVITIIVLVILTATVILTAFNNGILDRSEEAVFKNNIRTLQEDFANKKLKAQLKNKGLDTTKINGMNMGLNDNPEDIKYWIPSITNDFIDRIFISNGVFKADQTKFTEQQIAWLEDLGIDMGIAPVLGTTDLWQLDETKTIITAYLGNLNNDMNLDVDITIPNKIKDIDTQQIYIIKEVAAENVFSTNGESKQVNILTISDNLIINSDISKDLLANKLYIGDNVTFKSGLECESNSVYFKRFNELTIGNNVRIEGKGIYNNIYITKLEIGDNFYCDGIGSLGNLDALEELTIGNNSTLQQCSLNTNKVLRKVNIGKGLSILEAINDINRFLSNNEMLEEVNIASFKNLGTNALRDCTVLEKVVLEDGGVISGSYSFGNCTGIKVIELGDVDMSSTSATNTFTGCTGIEKVIIKKGAGKNLKTGLFSKFTSIKDVILEDNSTTTSNMFNGCSGIENITIGNNVTLEVRTFVTCAGLKSITIPASTTLKQTVFGNCTGLTDVTLKEGLTEIAQTMFQKCTSLKSIIIPNTVTNIGSSSFSGSGITTIKFNKTTDEVTKISEYENQWGATNATIECTDGTITNGVVTLN